MNSALTKKSKTILRTGAVLTLSLLVSCGGSPEYSATKLNRLMVMGLVANPPALQLPVGGYHTISMDPYISDVGGSGSVTLRVQSCVDPGFENGLQKDCTNAVNATPIQTVVVQAPYNTSAGVFGTPERTGRISSGPIPVSLLIPAGFLNNYSAVEQFNGVSYLIAVKVISEKDTVQSFRKILISSQFPNQNPTISTILADGAPLDELPKKEVDLSIDPLAGPEAYQRMATDGSIRPQLESLQTVWFTSDGSLPEGIKEYRQPTEWKPPANKPVGRAPVLVGVLRDERGGMNVVVKKF